LWGVGCRPPPGAGRRSPELLARRAVVGGEGALGGALEDKVARRRQRAAVPRRDMLLAPRLLLLHRIPGDQPAEHRRLGGRGVERVADVPAEAAHELAGLIDIVL